MSTTIELGKTSAKGGFNLFWGTAISSVISAVSIIVIARILSPSEYGLLGITLIAPTLVEIIRDLGIDQATIKYTAQYNAENKQDKIKNVLVTAITFELLLGVILSFILFFASGFIADNILDRPEITSLIQICSLTIIAGALFKVPQSAFLGYEKIEYYSITLVIQSIIKSVLMIVLVSIGLGIYGAIIGNTISYILIGIVSIIILYLKVYKELPSASIKKMDVWKNFKKMFKYGLPLSVSNIINEVKIQFLRFLIAIYLSDQIFGNYQAATNFAIIVAFFVTPIQTILFPAFSKINSHEEPEVLRNAFSSSVKYASLLIIPSTFMVITLAKPAIFTIYGEKYEFAPVYLSLYILGYLYTAVGSQSSENLIKSQGRTDVNLKLTLLTASLGIVFSIMLVPNFGVPGLICATLLGTIPSLLASLWWIKKHFNTTIEWKSSAKIVAASAIASLITYLGINQLLTNWITLILGAIIYLIAITIIAPLIGALSKKDIKNLKEMLKALGPLERVFSKPLNVIERMITIFHKE